jgi:hypothetical protein
MHRPVGSCYREFMPNYRRLLVPGGQYFFTVNLRVRDTRLLVERIDEFRAAYRSPIGPFEKPL